MKIIASKRSALAKTDQLQLVRKDGSDCSIDMPRQGILPHDLLHVVVESGFALPGGFLSLVASGMAASFAMERSHAPSMVQQHEAGLAEAMVEAMQTQLWSGQYNHSAFEYGIQTAATMRSIEQVVTPSESDALAVYEQAIALNVRWTNLAEGQTLVVDFLPPLARSESE